MSWTVVVPTCRPERFHRFLAEWQPLFREHRAALIVCEDADEHFVSKRLWSYGHRAYCRKEIPDWIPRRTDMIRSWGIYQAWKLGSRYTLSLDDDVLPAEDVFSEYEAVFDNGAVCSDYLNVGALTTYGKPLRGLPYRDRTPVRVAIQYGGWDGVLDYDAATQLVIPQQDERFIRAVQVVPRGAAVTGCAMNMAWRTDRAPLMWQLPLLDGRHNRFGDIWAGLFAKRACDHAGHAVVVNGKATVRHERASDPITNLEREASGIRLNEALWQALGSGDYRQVTDSAARFFTANDPEYGAHFKDCRDRWLSLFY